MFLSYRYRIEPSKKQSALLTEMLGDFCELYNAALEHRKRAKEKGVSIKCYDQIRALTAIRRDLPNQGRWAAVPQQQIMRKIEDAYHSAFRRLKNKIKPGFPRFKAKSQYQSAAFRIGEGLVIRKSNKIRIVGVLGEIKVRWHRDLPSKPKSAILSRNGGKWYIIFHVEVAPVERASPDSIGVDVGLTSLIALSNGETIARPNITKRNARRLRVLQRTLARAKRGSKGRKRAKAAVAKLQAHIGNARRDNLHKLSASLVARFGRIAIEDLNVKGLAAGMLAKHVNDAAWSMLTGMLAYKAERAGCELVKVDARWTSQTCPECGIIAKKTLATREHCCDCGCSLDRDVAAAIVIHNRAFQARPLGASGESLIQRVAA